MRILHVIRSVDPAGGGPIEVVTQLGLEHHRQGREVEVVTLDAPGSAALANFPLTVHALGPVWNRYGYSPRVMPWLRDHLSRFDAVVVNGLWCYHGFAVWRATRGTACRYTVFTHGMLDPWFKRRYPWKHVKKWLYWPWAEYRILRDADAVFFTSEDERRHARDSFWLYRCRERVIPYGTAAPPVEFAGDSAAGLFRQTVPAAEGKRVVLFLGRIHDKKGCDLLIKAFGSLARTTKDGAGWHLVLAGPVATAETREELGRLARRYCPSGSVTWTGMLTGAAKWAAFRAADVFILTSHQENFGVAVSEALSCGLPVLISNRVNIWRQVEASEAGLIEPDNQTGARHLLERWAALDDESRRRMRANARRCHARHFNLADAAAHLASELGEVRG